jgi:DNA-binding transcriptional LysR family regulator
MLDPARRALAEADRALADARAEIARAAVSVRVGVVGYAPRVIVAELMRALSDEAIELVPHELTFAEQLRRLNDGRLDVALGTVPAAPTTLAAEPLFREHLVAVVPSHHELAALDEVPLERLAEVPLVLADPGRHEDWNRFVRDAFRARGLEPRVAREAFASLATAHAILDRGDRCTVLTSLAATTPQRRVVMRSITPRVDWTTAIVWHPAAHTPAVDGLVISARRLRDEQSWQVRRVWDEGVDDGAQLGRPVAASSAMSVRCDPRSAE